MTRAKQLAAINELPSVVDARHSNVRFTLKGVEWPPHAIEMEPETQTGLCPEGSGRPNLCSKAPRFRCLPRLVRETYQFDERQAIRINWLSNCGTVIALLANE